MPEPSVRLSKQHRGLETSFAEDPGVYALGGSLSTPLSLRTLVVRAGPRAAHFAIVPLISAVSKIERHTQRAGADTLLSVHQGTDTLMPGCHTHIVNKNRVRALAVLVFGAMLLSPLRQPRP